MRKPQSKLTDLQNRFTCKVYEVKNVLDFAKNRTAAQNFIKRNKGKWLIIVTK